MLQNIWHFVADNADRFFHASPARLWFGAFAVGIVVERLATNAEAGQSYRGYLRNAAYSLIYLAAIVLAAPPVYGVLAVIRAQIGAAGGLVDLQIVDNSTYLHQVVIFVIFFLIIDFFQYWWHRAQHWVPVLWDQHAVHHSEEAMNVTTATRHHWSEFVFQAFVISLPVGFLFKITPAGAGIVATAFGSWQFFVHSNMRLNLGPVTRVLAGPQIHRIHHSRLPQHLDRNFAAYFPIWDMLFGTYYHPAPGEFPPTGISGTRIESVWGLSIYPFVRWSHRIGRAMRRARRRDQPPALL
ncbi:MAG TPA: sterol desaturase family protein [Acetobacteraceae bacterium]|nr:sterol desaturase family protein [Acetobacteraceae bacterium]